MDIKEVLNLPIDTKVKNRKEQFIVTNTVCGGKGLRRINGGFLTLSEDGINAEYELVHKKLTFFEAMRLVDEGKVVESSFSRYIFKKDIYGRLVCKEKEMQEEIFDTNDICIGEITGDWYEVTE